MTVENLSLVGKVAIVTGSGRETGIGAAIAKTLARNGASVTINYVSDKVTARAEAVVKAIKDFRGQATVIQSDVTSPNGAKLLVHSTLQAFGVDHIDILGRLKVDVKNSKIHINSKQRRSRLSKRHSGFHQGGYGLHVRCQCLRSDLHGSSGNSSYASRWSNHQHFVCCFESWRPDVMSLWTFKGRT